MAHCGMTQIIMKMFFDDDPDTIDEDTYDEIAEQLGLDRSLDFYNLGQNQKVKSNQLDAKSRLL